MKAASVKLTMKTKDVPRSIAPKSDFDWFLTATMDQEPYKGKFVAILNGQIVAEASTYKEALYAAKDSFKGRKPLISYIPNDEGQEV